MLKEQYFHDKQHISGNKTAHTFSEMFNLSGITEIGSNDKLGRKNILSSESISVFSV